MSRKKRILFVNEFSQLNTGFSTIAYYLLPLLHATGKYEIAEHASYVGAGNPLIKNCSWKVYPNEPSNSEEAKMYQQDRMNQFGKYKLEEVLMDFQPDIVISWRDPYFDEFIPKTPLRKYFKWVHMTTCDSAPQKREWMEMFANADVLLTYSFWAKNLLENQSGNRLKVTAVTSPGVDTDIFYPENKADVKNKWGITPDTIIFGSIMRNQPRKLFPDLMRAFVRYLEICKASGRDDLAKRSYLYFHTSIPDVGWDISSEIKRHRLSHKILFTQICKACGYVYPGFYNGEVSTCRNCANKSVFFSNTLNGVDRKTLAKIINTFDVYIQYSTCEGFGMCGPDAKACAVPVIGGDYSATADQVNSPGGEPIPIEKFFQEPLNQTNQIRSLPSNEETAKMMFRYASMGEAYRAEKGMEGRRLIENEYSWPKIAKIWEKIIDDIEVLDPLVTWQSQPNIRQLSLSLPNNLSNEQFMGWCYDKVLGKPDLIGSDEYLKLLNSLNLGYETGQNEFGQSVRMPIDRKKIIDFMIHQVQSSNGLEQYRYNKIVEPWRLAKPELIYETV